MINDITMSILNNPFEIVGIDRLVKTLQEHPDVHYITTNTGVLNDFAFDTNRSNSTRATGTYAHTVPTIYADTVPAIIKKAMDIPEDEIVDAVCDAAEDDVVSGETLLDNIERVVYKLKKNGKDTRLATIVFWKDGFKTVVGNSSLDPVDVVTVDGVETASEQAKEVGLIYSILKYIMGKEAEDGSKTVDGDGYMNKIARTIRDKGYDCQVEPARAAARKEEAYQRHLQKVKDDQARKRRREAGRKEHECKCEGKCSEPKLVTAVKKMVKRKK
jgi:hypothetical protein